MPLKAITDCTVGEAYLALLADRGVDCMFANAGTDFAPLIEAFAKAETQGTAVPRPVTVPHENVAMAMAIGYAVMTDRPQVVMVHVNVGTANALCGLMNASRGDVPVLFTAGRTPITEQGHVGSRDIDIHWAQEMFDQAGVVREVVKWDYELRNAAQLETVVDRALNMAMSEPQGPVYLTLPREVLAEGIERFEYASPTRRVAPAGSQPSPAALDEAAAIIAAAENPMIITTSAGRTEACVAALGELAESFAIPVIQYRPRNLCLPSDHPMSVGYEPGPLMQEADVILVIDAMVPWLPARTSPADGAQIIHLAADPQFSKLPIRGFPCDLALAGSIAPSLAALTEALASRQKSAKGRIDARRRKFAAVQVERAERRRETIRKVRDETPIHPHWITHCLNELRTPDAVMVRESQMSPAFMNLTVPRTFFKAGASAGLGVGLGVAIGAKMATPERLVIATEGDGSYMFANPIAAHYVAQAEGAPFLTVIYNNQRWNAVHEATLRLNPDGFAARSNREPLTHFEGDAKLERAVEIHGGYGVQVKDPRDLPKVLEKALDMVAGEGRQAVVNVTCSSP